MLVNFVIKVSSQLPEIFQWAKVDCQVEDGI